MASRGSDFKEWISTITWDNGNSIKNIISGIINYLKSMNCNLESGISMIGFCFGGWVCCKTASESSSFGIKIDRIIIPHPR